MLNITVLRAQVNSTNRTVSEELTMRMFHVYKYPRTATSRKLPSFPNLFPAAPGSAEWDAEGCIPDLPDSLMSLDLTAWGVLVKVVV